MASVSAEENPLLQETGQPIDTKVKNTAINPDSELQGKPLYLALTFPLLALFLVAIDVTLTSTISATVAADFASLSLISWLGSSYLVALTITQTVSGSLTDRYGRRSGFLVGLLFFAVGNLMCGLAPSASILIIARAIAGAGGGAINSITTFVISDLLSMRRRPVWQAIGSMAWALGMGLGGVLGGLMNDMIGWRSAFIALTPLTALVAVGAYFTFVKGLPRAIELGKGKHSQSIDYLGSIMLSGMLVCFVLGLNLMEDGLPREGKMRVLTLALLGAGGAFLAALVAVEKWFAANPVIPLHLLADRSVISSCLAGVALSCSFQTLLYYIPIFVQVQGFGTSEVGLQLLGEPIGAATGPFIVGLIIRHIGSYALMKPIVWIVYTAATLLFYLCRLETPVWIVFGGLVIMGAGIGSVLTVNLTGLLANVEHQYQAKSISMAYVFRQTGASVGLAVSGLIFRSIMRSELLHTASSQISDAPDQIARVCNRHKIEAGNRPGVCVAYAKALHSVFLFTLIAALIGLFFGMLIQNQPLDRNSESHAESEGVENEV